MQVSLECVPVPAVGGIADIVVVDEDEKNFE